jgi:uncharacterized protein (DUF1697 family)
MTWIALLRGVNVGGNRMVAMADLRALLASLGFDRPRSLLQSGNLVFDGPRRSPAALEARIQAAVAKHAGFEPEIFVRTAAEWHDLVAGNPFAEAAAHDPGHLLVMCFRRAPSAAEVASLRAAITGPERVEAIGRHAYFVYPAGVGTSKLTNAVIERRLGSPGTARNWNTVLKLAATAGGGVRS